MLKDYFAKIHHHEKKLLPRQVNITFDKLMEIAQFYQAD